MTEISLTKHQKTLLEQPELLKNLDNEIIELIDERNSRPEVLCKKCVPRNFTKFTRKKLWQRLLFNKFAGLGLQLYQKKASATGVFL